MSMHIYSQSTIAVDYMHQQVGQCKICMHIDTVATYPPGITIIFNAVYGEQRRKANPDMWN